MTKQEFLDHVNSLLSEKERINTITDEEYSVIETVYIFHPAISEVNGKDKIARLYVDFGWSVIMDMEPRAKLMVEKIKQHADLRSSLLALEQDMDIIKDGGWL